MTEGGPDGRDSTPSAEVNLTVTSMAGDAILSLTLASGDTIRKVREAVEDAVPGSHVQQLLLEHRILQDTQTIEEARVPTVATLQAVLGILSAKFRVKGGVERACDWETTVKIGPGDLDSVEARQRQLEAMRGEVRYPCTVSKLEEIDGSKILELLMAPSQFGFAEGSSYAHALAQKPEEAERLKAFLHHAESGICFYYSIEGPGICPMYGTSSLDVGCEALIAGHHLSLAQCENSY